MNSNQPELPLYRCHKEVRAVKIKAVHQDLDRGVLVPENPTLPLLRVDAEYMRKHRPQPGGYYVLYGDGYESFSPAPAFEEGYARVWRCKPS